MSGTVENYFILLELYPEGVSVGEIEKAIFFKKKEWSRNMNSSSPVIKREAQENLQNITKIEEKLLHNPKEREKQAAEAQKLIQDNRNKYKAEYEKEIRRLSISEIIDDKILEKTSKKFPGCFYMPEKIQVDISALRSSSKSSNTKTEASNPEESINKTTLRTIQENLRVLKKKDLYDFLGCSQGDSIATLKIKIEQRDKEIKSIAIKDAKNSTESDLIGYCRTYLTDNQKKAAYDTTLKAQSKPSSVLKDDIDFFTSQSSVNIDAILMLLNNAEQAKINHLDAIQSLQEAATKRRPPVSINVDLSFDFTADVKCSCGTQTKALKGNCKKCGKPLFAPCINCGISVAIDQLGCGTCNHSLEDSFKKLKNAFENSSPSADLIHSLWKESYRGHSAFSELVKKYEDFNSLWQKQAEEEKRQKAFEDQRRQREEALAEKLSNLEEAIKQRDLLKVRRYWDAELTSKLSKESLELVREAQRPNEVMGVIATHHGSYIEIRWELEDNDSNYLVCWSSESYIENPKYLGKNDHSKAISKGQQRQRATQIINPKESTYYISVFKIEKFLGEDLLSPGRNGSCRYRIGNISKQRINYSLKIKKGLFQKPKAILSLESSENIGIAPSLVFVAKLGHAMPLSLNQDCIKVENLTNISLTAGKKYTQTIDISNIRSPARFRLFAADPQEDQRMELEPVNSDELRF